MGEQDASPSYTDAERAALERADGDPTELSDDDVAILQGLLEHENPHARVDALDAIKSCVYGIDYEPIPNRLESLYPTVARCLNDDEADVRAGAAIALDFVARCDADYIPPSAPATLLNILKRDDETSARSTAAAALGSIGAADPNRLPEGTVQSLVYALDDGEWQVEDSAAPALGRIGETAPARLEGTEAVARLLENHDTTSVDTASPLGWIGSADPDRLAQHDVVERLVEQADADTYRRRVDAVDSLGNVVEEAPTLLSDAVVEAVARATNDEESLVRWKAARVLGQFARAAPDSIESDLLDPLVDLFADDEASCREWAISAVERAIEADPERVAAVHGIEALVGELRTLLHDSSPKVQKAAAAALGTVGGAYPDYIDTSLLDALLAVESERPAGLSGLSARAQAYTTVGTLGRERPSDVEDRHIDALLDAEGADASSRLSAVKWIADGSPRLLADAGYVERLAASLDAEEANVRNPAARALATVAQDHPNRVVRAGVTDAIRNSLRETDPPLGAVRTLGNLGVGRRDRVDEVVDALDPLLDHDTDVAAVAAAELLRLEAETVPASAALDALQAALRSGRRWMRVIALGDVAEVAETHPERVAPLTDDVVAALDSEFAEVREAACETLVALDATHTIEDVQALTDDDAESVRTTAEDAMAALSDELKPNRADSAEVPDAPVADGDTAASESRTSSSADRDTPSDADSPIPDVDADATVPNLDLDAQRDLLTLEPVETHGGAAADVRIVDLDGERDVDRVAAKLPRTAGSVTDDLLERFVQEARNWEELAEHPHVVGLHDWGTEPVPWLVLEYMDGGTLAARLETFDVAQALWTAVAIARAVWHGHRHGTHHRDLKPQNVLFRETPEDVWDVPKVADWGSARRHADRTSPSAGYTPEYAAPEQIQPSEYDALDERTDVFQLGVVCYELCTGEHPFNADGPPAAVMMAIISGEPEPASEVRETLPAELDDVLRRALATNPSDRYETALDLARDLEDVYETVRASVAERDANGTTDGTTDGSSDAIDGYTTGDVQRYSRESDREINLFASALATIEQNEDVEPATVSRSELLRTGWQLIRRLAVLEPWERAVIIDVTIANDDVTTRYGPRVLRGIDMETWHSWVDTADFSSRRWSDLFQSDDEIESLDDLDRYVTDLDQDLADLETLAETESRRESDGRFSRLRRKIELERKHLSFVREYVSENR
ncbi:HEAT repeat domain-containing protein (plasmid) [Halarchaeum sp. CBA1220]|uniref:protein kinase domain-containing protein n=1 Tax=Halarchaeum sp. CBA1220 TaxID=1853682 RepID=UPI000F3AA7B7|nr:protein kinase [Halarchaeum sp. CBA1220]QLC35564.1 HEAT repeat domain-containing protein [Halarchaeum sp. CBA1220]